MPKIPEHLRTIKTLSQLEVCKMVSKYARMTRIEMQDAVDDPATNVLELAIAKIFAESIKHGDYTRLSFLLDRSLGKIPVIVEDDESKAARQEIESLSDQELLRLVKLKIPEIESELK